MEPTLMPTHAPSDDPMIGEARRRAVKALEEESRKKKEAEEEQATDELNLRKQLLVAQEVGRWLAPVLLVLSMVGLYGMVIKLVHDLSKDGKLHRFELNDYQCIMVFVSNLALGLYFLFNGYFPSWFSASTGVIGANKAVKLAVMLLLWALPDNIAFWSFSVLVFHWAGILYGGPKMGARAGSAMGGLRTVFLVTNGVLTVESILSWVLILCLPSEEGVRIVGFAHQLLFAFTALVLSVSVLFFGISLSKTISKSAKRFAGSDAAAKRNRVAARKSAVVAIVFSIIWLLSTVLRFIPALTLQFEGIRTMWLDYRTAFDLSYWLLNILATCIVLFMYGPFKALSDYLSSKIDQLSKWYTRSHATKHGHQKQTDAAASPKEPLSNKSLGIERIESIGLARESQSGIHTDSSGSKFAQA